MLVVAVETVETDDGIVAAAVVYPVNTSAPSFSYTDARGRRRVVGLSNFGRLSAVHQRNIVRYLKNSALSYAVVARRDDDRAAASVLAVGRALERVAHGHGTTVHRDRVRVHLTGRHYLPTDSVGEVQQCLWSKRKLAPWFVTAAAVLAKTPNDRMMAYR